MSEEQSSDPNWPDAYHRMMLRAKYAEDRCGALCEFLRESRFVFDYAHACASGSGDKTMMADVEALRKRLSSIVAATDFLARAQKAEAERDEYKAFIESVYAVVLAWLSPTADLGSVGPMQRIHDLFKAARHEKQGGGDGGGS